MKKGFTLAELVLALIVMATIAILSIGVIIPSGDVDSIALLRKSMNVMNRALALERLKTGRTPLSVADGTELVDIFFDNMNIVNRTASASSADDRFSPTGNTIYTASGMIYEFFIYDKCLPVKTMLEIIEATNRDDNGNHKGLKNEFCGVNIYLNGATSDNSTDNVNKFTFYIGESGVLPDIETRNMLLTGNAKVK